MESETHKLSDLAKVQRERWGISRSSSHRLPMLKEAKRSAYEYSHQLYEKEFKKVKKQFPPNWNESMITNFLGRNNYALNEYQDEIFEAARRNDINFFISLGKLVDRQQSGKTSFAKNAFTPKKCPDYIIFFWVEGLLWLMTDEAALGYLTLVVGTDFDKGTYQRARGRLKKLIRHPDLPITGIVESTSLSSKSMPQTDQLLTLKLRRGWRFVDGQLTKG